MFAYQININCPNHKYVQKILNANMNFAKSCKCLSLTNGINPRFFKCIVVNAITVIAETNILAKIYQANKVLYQCGVIDINQSQAIVDSVVMKNNRKNTDILK